jgi:hypothetical protein
MREINTGNLYIDLRVYSTLNTVLNGKRSRPLRNLSFRISTEWVGSGSGSQMSRRPSSNSFDFRFEGRCSQVHYRRTGRRPGYSLAITGDSYKFAIIG